MQSRGQELQRRCATHVVLCTLVVAAGRLVAGNLSLEAFCTGSLPRKLRSSIARAATAAAETQQDLRPASEGLKKIRRYADQGLADEAEDALYEMIDEGGKLEAAHFGAVIAACAKGVDIERAERWIFRMKALQVTPDRNVYHALMRVAAEAGSPQNIDEWMKEAWKAGHEPDHLTFMLMLRALRKAKKTVEVESWFERLMETGLKPDIACVNEVIGAYIDQNNLVKASEWFGIAKQNLALEPDVHSYKLMLSGLTLAGKTQDAESLFDKMIEQGIRPDASTYVMMTGGGKASRSNAFVERWSQRLLDSGVELDGNSYTALLGAWAAVGDSERVEDLFSQMMQDGLATSEALAIVVDALMLSDAAEGMERAEEWIQQFVENGKELTPAVYAALASPDVLSGDFEQVEARMQQMEASGLEMDEDCLTVMLFAYANAQPQQVLLAEQMFKQQMLRGKIRATTEVLEALRAAVGGARCLSLRRELQISTVADPLLESGRTNAIDLLSAGPAAARGMAPRPWRMWKQFRTEQVSEPLTWE